MTTTERRAEAGRSHRALTVAHVRQRSQEDFVEVLFLESARIFRLSRAHERFDQIVSRLHEAEVAGRPVRVTFAAANSDLIEDIVV
jgi:hypothetical protein